MGMLYSDLRYRQKTSCLPLLHSLPLLHNVLFSPILYDTPNHLHYNSRLWINLQCICCILFEFRYADITYGLYISPLSMAAVEQLTTKDLLFPFRDSFHSIVDIESLIVVMDQNQLLRRKEMKLLQRVDETAKKSYIFTKLYSANQSLSANRLVQLFTETANERNLQFSKALTSILSSAQKSDTIGQYIYSTHTSLQCAHCCRS